MYGVIYLIQFPDDQDLAMQSLEEAEQRVREIVTEFIDEYGEDDIEYGTESNPVTIMYNGEVTGYAFIEKVSNHAETEV